MFSQVPSVQNRWNADSRKKRACYFSSLESVPFEIYEDKNKSKSKVERIPIVASASKPPAASAPFTIYCDEDKNESESENRKIPSVASASKPVTSAPFNIYCDEDKNESESEIKRNPVVAHPKVVVTAPFNIYCDEPEEEDARYVSQPNKQGKGTSSRHEFVKPFSVLSPPKPVFGNKENKSGTVVTNYFMWRFVYCLKFVFAFFSYIM